MVTHTEVSTDKANHQVAIATEKTFQRNAKSERLDLGYLKKPEQLFQ